MISCVRERGKKEEELCGSRKWYKCGEVRLQRFLKPMPATQ